VSGTRITRRFAELRADGRAGLVTFVTAGDPDLETSTAILAGLAGAGADVIELGMPFSDPMADGPSIQVAGQRALGAGHTMRRTLDMVARFRERDDATPVVLMGYFNPIHHMGVEAFVAAARGAGVDGLIVVDLPPEEEDELRGPAQNTGIDLIRLIAPSTGDARINHLMANSGGFIYYVSVSGITGTKSATQTAVAAGVARIRAASELPVAVGFGIKTPGQAADVAAVADAAVVGSAIVDRIADGLDDAGHAGATLVEDVLAFVGELAAGVRGARMGTNTGIEQV
jgi:tryptophan synthase alpha chain